MLLLITGSSWHFTLVSTFDRSPYYRSRTASHRLYRPPLQPFLHTGYNLQLFCRCHLSWFNQRLLLPSTPSGTTLLNTTQTTTILRRSAVTQTRLTTLRQNPNHSAISHIYHRHLQITGHWRLPYLHRIFRLESHLTRAIHSLRRGYHFSHQGHRRLWEQRN